jgi:Phosphotransferase enzyme family
MRLRGPWGEAVVVRAIGSSPRSRVWRVEFGGGPAIVKRVVGGGDAQARFEREIAALRLAAAVRPAVVPELLGSDPDDRVMVLEHIEADGPTAAGWQADYAVGLARLHAAARFLPDTIPAAPVPATDVLPAAADVTAFLAFAGRLGVTASAAVEGELLAVVERLATAGRTALLHGDPCPDNGVPTATGLRFLDLEQAAVGPGALELAYLSVGFPTCWCVASVPGPVLAEAEAAYRATWRSITGTEPAGDLTDAKVGWVISGDALVQRARRGTVDHLARAARRDWRWGTATARGRLLHRLGVVAAAARDRDDLTHMARLCTGLSARLLLRRPPPPLPIAPGDPLSRSRP